MALAVFDAEQKFVTTTGNIHIGEPNSSGGFGGLFQQSVGNI